MTETTERIHLNQPLRSAGAALSDATRALLLVHGRGGNAAGMLELGRELIAESPNEDTTALVAPQAFRSTWYPDRFLAPVERNEPWLSSALAKLKATMQRLAADGIASDQVVLVGFSQGACLALEFAARNAQPLGGVIAFSGGLIGADDGERADLEGDLENTPVFLGCSDVDAHIPVRRVHQAETVFVGMGAAVTKRIYPGMGHTINADEVAHARKMVQAL